MVHKEVSQNMEIVTYAPFWYMRHVQLFTMWVKKQLKHNSINKTAVASANKLSRMAWAILSSDGQYQVPVAQEA